MTTVGALVTFVGRLVAVLLHGAAVRRDAGGGAGARPRRERAGTPRLLLKAAVTTVLAALATWGIAWFIGSGSSISGRTERSRRCGAPVVRSGDEQRCNGMISQ